MSRETRLIAVMLVFGIVGIAALSFVASQYRKRVPLGAVARAAEPRVTGTLRPDLAADAAAAQEAARRAAREVEGFLAARAAAQEVCARYGDKLKAVAGAVTGNFEGVAGKRIGYGLDVISTYKIERLNAFTAHGMDYASYAAAREAWRAWRAGTSGGADAALVAGFEARRAEAEKAGLGELESFDDAIK